MGDVEAAFSGHEKLPADPGLGIEKGDFPAHGSGNFRSAETCRTGSDDGYVELFHINCKTRRLKPALHSNQFQPGEILGVDEADRLAVCVHNDDVVDAFLTNLFYGFHGERVFGEGYGIPGH